MNDLSADLGSTSLRYRVFTWTKYLTYLALCFNIYLFFEQETATVLHSVSGDVSFLELVQLFSATLDTAAWVVLLLLFELETAVIPDEKLVGATRLVIHGVRLLCGAAIVSAFFGYWGEWLALWEAAPLAEPVCSLVGQNWSVMNRFDNFSAIDAGNCGALGTDLVVLTGLDSVVATPETWAAAQWMGLVDVINSAAWILVVIILEAEVRILESRLRLPDAVMPLVTVLKVLLYLTLAGAAVFWWFKGDFLDFWDAALWLFAFVFIELNVFEWQREIHGASKTHGAI